jgi:hypothetical protein
MQYFFAYWWVFLVFGGLLMGAWSNWLAYRRRKDELDTLKHMAEHGKDPPPELLKAVTDPYDDGGPHPYYGRRWRYGRYGAFWEWRRAIFFGALAGGLYWWANYSDFGGHAHDGIMIAAVVMAILAAVSLFTAVAMTVFRPK